LSTPSPYSIALLYGKMSGSMKMRFSGRILRELKTDTGLTCLFGGAARFFQ
jgi:hypothetical protein